MSELTDRYALPLLQSGQAQKEITHNEAVGGIDTLLHLAVETQTLAAPPASPASGQTWLVAAGATGAWVGRAGQLASFGTGGWRFTVPREGCVAWLRDLAIFAVFTAGGWRSDAWPAAGLRIGTRTILQATPAAVAAPSGGTVIDAEARAKLGELLVVLRGLGLVG